MNPTLVTAFAALLALVPMTVQDPQDPQDPQQGKADMAAMMKRARRYTEPGEKHELLERFLGDWTSETRLFMGGRSTPATAGSMSCSWKHDGRWLECNAAGKLMGQPVESTTLLGYDNFKQSYVSVTVSTMDTAMNTVEGDLDPRTGALLMYGTIDEYLTGEHDKAVKVVWRFPSDDEMVMEVHDLAIGETDTKVIETRYRRE